MKLFILPFRLALHSSIIPWLCLAFVLGYFLIGRIVRLKRGKHPPRLLTASMSWKRVRDRPFRTTRDAFSGNAKTISLEAGSRGRASDRTGCTANAVQWERMAKEGE